MDKIDAIIAKKKQQRADRWQRLQQEAPDTAAFIALISETFGKPASLKVKFGDEDVEKWK